MKPWLLRDEAEDDVRNAARWYERERVGRGEDFILLVEQTLAMLEQTPTLAGPMPRSPADLDIRRWLMRRFPYAIVALEMEDAYEVLAVAHVRRHPNYWHARLKKPSP